VAFNLGHDAPFPGDENDLLQHTARALSSLINPSVELAFATLLHCAGLKDSSSGEKKLLSDKSAALSSIKAENICRRLRMSRESIERITDLVREQPKLFQAKEMRESTLKRLLRKPHFAEHLELHRAHARSRGIALDCYDFCRRKLKEYEMQPHAPVLIKGEDLIALGYSPGPHFQKMLRSVEDLQLEGELRTKKDAIEYLNRAFSTAVIED